MNIRITKIACPSCEGTGKFSPVFDFACAWCRGEKRLTTEKAHSYADNLYMIAGGGYICGDHDRNDKIEMEKRAEEIYALTRSSAPWNAKPSTPPTHVVGWQHISTAPRDGSEVLIWTGRQRHVAHYDRIESEWVSPYKTTTKRLAVSPKPKLWMPLPAAPVSATAAEGDTP